MSPEAIRLAVIAHIRHVHTNYDELLCGYADRQIARWEIQDQVAADAKAANPATDHAVDPLAVLATPVFTRFGWELIPHLF